VARFAAPLRFKGSGPLRLLGPALNGVSSGEYRGVVEVVHDGGGLTAINELDIDSYVRGVVAGEMPSSWPLEALKAQAVTARSYALATRKTTGLFDQYPDTRSQVYRGVTGESVRSDAAVAQTAGRVLTYGGEPAVTYYFSTSGGHTENVEFSFVGSLAKPWLVGVPDPHDSQSPYHRWSVSITEARLDRALGAPGRFKRLQVVDRGVSPRVVRARVIGTAGSTELTGPQIRARLGLRDTWFTFVRVSSAVRHARSARPASWGPRLLAPTLAGSYTPTPKRRRLIVERRGNGRWLTITKIRTTKDGRYRLDIGRGGVYRVRAGDVAGPSVRIR
jgi:stage II sporulation protein D